MLPFFFDRRRFLHDRSDVEQSPNRAGFGYAPDLDSIDLPDLTLYLRHMVFARVQGRMEWCCPFCGHLNYSTLHYANGFKVRCNGSDCRRKLAVGLTFYPMASGFKIPAPD